MDEGERRIRMRMGGGDGFDGNANAKPGVKHPKEIGEIR
jgi:hypothetical protein